MVGTFKTKKADTISVGVHILLDTSMDYITKIKTTKSGVKIRTASGIKMTLPHSRTVMVMDN